MSKTEQQIQQALDAALESVAALEAIGWEEERRRAESVYERLREHAREGGYDLGLHAPVA